MESTDGRRWSKVVEDGGLKLCKDKCNSDVNCNYIFFNDDKFCGLYSACDPTRTPSVSGLTLTKTGNKLLYMMVELVVTR